MPEKKCPTCRTRYTDTRAVPKIISSMLDELMVKCPHTKAGCTWVDHRSNVSDHVMLYCVYTPVACSSFDCRHHIAQKDFHKGCLHYTVSCEQCHTSMMKKDLEVSATVPSHCILLTVHPGTPTGCLSRPIDKLSPLLGGTASA
jgi:hypothetical protein